MEGLGQPCGGSSACAQQALRRRLAGRWHTFVRLAAVGMAGSLAGSSHIFAARSLRARQVLEAPRPDSPKGHCLESKQWPFGESGRGAWRLQGPPGPGTCKPWSAGAEQTIIPVPPKREHCCHPSDNIAQSMLRSRLAAASCHGCGGSGLPWGLQGGRRGVSATPRIEMPRAAQALHRSRRSAGRPRRLGFSGRAADEAVLPSPFDWLPIGACLRRALPPARRCAAAGEDMWKSYVGPEHELGDWLAEATEDRASPLARCGRIAIGLQLAVAPCGSVLSQLRSSSHVTLRERSLNHGLPSLHLSCLMTALFAS